MAETYIKRRPGGGLAFNMKIPKRLAHHFTTRTGKPGTHITIGLGTREMAVAIPKARALALQTKADFDRLEMQPAADAATPDRIYQETFRRYAGETGLDEAARIDRTKALAAEAIAIQQELDRRNIESYDPVPADLQARMDALSDARRALKGFAPDNADRYEPLFLMAARQWLENWKKSRRKAGQSTAAASQYEPATRLFADYIGPKPLRQITRADVERYGAILASFDRNWGRSAKTRSLGFWDLKARYAASDTPMTGQAVRRHLQILSMLWEWADKEGWCDSHNPFRSVMKRYGGAALPALPFTAAELERLFSPTPPRSDLHEAMLLALFTGLRAREIAALCGGDIIMREGVICLAISSKTRPRRLPLHPALSWLRDRYGERAAGAPFWPRLHHGGRGADLIKLFGDFKRARGFSSRQKGFQSFQKTVQQQLASHQTPTAIWQALMGLHSKAGSYRPDPASMRQLQEAVNRLDYGSLDLSPPGIA